VYIPSLAVIQTSTPPAGAGAVSRIVCTAPSPPAIVDGDTEPGASATGFGAEVGAGEAVEVGAGDGVGVGFGRGFLRDASACTGTESTRSAAAAAAPPATH
jgi:hypothetical protein